MSQDLLQLRPEGLYCPPGDFYIDPDKRVERAVVTHAHGDHARKGCRHYWSSASGMPILRERLGCGGGFTALAWGQRVAFGDVQVSLHPAGHILGSAQVRIEYAGEVWVASGDYKRADDPSCEAFEPVPCDTFVTEATFAVPEYRWQPTEAIIDEIMAWWQDCKREGKTALLYCYALGKTQRVLAELGRRSRETAYLHHQMNRLVNLYRKAGIAMLPTEPVGKQPGFFNWAGRLVLAPPGIAGTSWPRRFRPSSSALVSGWMSPASKGRAPTWDRGFALSDHADWPALLQSISDSGARRVLVTHGHGKALIEHLQSQGIEARALGQNHSYGRDAATETADD